MRTIKFRIWDKRVNQYCFLDSSFLLPFDTENYVIEQFTGLLDKNQKEIFEGDFIKGAGYVSFENGCFGVRIDYDIAFISLDEFNLQETEVIGNICENPGLAWNDP